MEVIRPLTAMGLTSGTSMDGVDAALLVTDGVDVFQQGKALNRPYDMEMRAELKQITGKEACHNEEKIKEVERKLTLFHAEVASELLDLAGLRAEDVDVLGFHGQTIFHCPDETLSIQIGDGDLLAEKTKIQVVNRFRNADIANGGQGGPLMSSYHEALARELEKPLIVLTLGGVAKISYIGENGELIAFDAGPGNALIDDWMLKKHGTNMDFEGSMASKGVANEKIIASMMKRDYFKKLPPKSLDRDEFSQKIMENLEGDSVENGAATLTAFTAQAIIHASENLLPSPAKRWIVCGGGANNPTLMRMLKQNIKAPLETAAYVHWQGDFLEAQGFAFLAVRSLFGLPISFPTTTGVPHSMCGGLLHKIVSPKTKNEKNKKKNS